MTGWIAVFRKEAANFFVSPIAYCVIAIFLAISGLFFFAYVSFMSQVSLQAMSNPMFAERINLTDVVFRPVVSSMSVILLFVAPLLTMRLFSEEKRSGTIELLLTYPVTDAGVLTGKFLAALMVLGLMLIGTATYPLLLLSVGKLDSGIVLTAYLGLLLLGTAFIAMGTFISSLTENQIIAAVIAFGAALIFWVISHMGSITGEPVASVLRQLSIIEHQESFHKGILSSADLSYFILFTAFFLFLTLRSLETHRWRG
jgi:ABC-2 type transport system permease protein